MFLPSINGFHFSNTDWPEVPDFTFSIPRLGEIHIGDASKGLCGGMAYAATDYYRAGLPIPETTTNPLVGDPLFSYISRRFLNSLDLLMGVMKVYGWMAYPGNLTRRTYRHELPKIMASLDDDEPVPIMIILMQSLNPVDLGHNHQIVVYDYVKLGDEIMLKVYDNNYPDDDQRTITCQPDSMEWQGSRSIRGLYTNDYMPVSPTAPPSVDDIEQLIPLDYLGQPEVDEEKLRRFLGIG